VGALCSSRASRWLGAGPALAWVLAIGLVILAPALVVTGRPEMDGASLSWVVSAGVINLVGSACVFSAFRLGKVSIIAPIVSAEGAFAAVIAVLAGEHLAALEVGVLTVIAAGIALAARSQEETLDHHPHQLGATALAVAAAVLFGFSLYATAQAGDVMPVPWVLLPARLIGTVALTLPLLLRGRLVMTREAAPLIGIAGVCEVAGLTAFTLGSRHGLAVAAVLGSQFAAVAAVAAYFLFSERLARLQVLGVAATLVGVACLSAVQR
jgi:drug/metabolite transporter (DMT)-like permease